MIKYFVFITKIDSWMEYNPSDEFQSSSSGNEGRTVIISFPGAVLRGVWGRDTPPRITDSRVTRYIRGFQLPTRQTQHKGTRGFTSALSNNLKELLNDSYKNELDIY